MLWRYFANAGASDLTSLKCGNAECFWTAVDEEQFKVEVKFKSFSGLRGPIVSSGDSLTMISDAFLNLPSNIFCSLK